MIEWTELTRRFVLHEGLKLQPYRCPRGFLTIGVGRNLEANPITPAEKTVVGDWQHGITKNAAYFLLRQDILRCRKACRSVFSFWSQLDDERQYALTDMCFNLGLSGLQKFRQMIEAMRIGDYRGAAKECLNSKYAKDVGTRAKRIARTIETGEFRI